MQGEDVYRPHPFFLVLKILSARAGIHPIWAEPIFSSQILFRGMRYTQAKTISTAARTDSIKPSVAELVLYP
jgi:hypothetical protein